MVLGKAIGILSLVIGALSVIPSLVSGIGVVGGCFSLILAGVAAALKEFRYSLGTTLITTISIFGFSVLTISNQGFNEKSLLFLGIPYLALASGLVIGLVRVRSREST